MTDLTSRLRFVNLLVEGSRVCGGGRWPPCHRRPPLEPNDNDNDEHRHHHGLMGAPMAQRPMWFTQIS